MRQNLKSRLGQDELELDKLDDRVVGRYKDYGINGVRLILCMRFYTVESFHLKILEIWL